MLLLYLKSSSDPISSSLWEDWHMELSKSTSFMPEDIPTHCTTPAIPAVSFCVATFSRCHSHLSVLCHPLSACSPLSSRPFTAPSSQLITFPLAHYRTSCYFLIITATLHYNSALYPWPSCDCEIS